jgi:hypothetical protein
MGKTTFVMQYLIEEFGVAIGIIIILITSFVLLYVLFLIIKWGVHAGTSDQRDLIEKQNEILKGK